ncbi:hypothetical protein GCM10022402_43940 [Salinactinospora qingdaonensis]|uniref:Uncharacterized protein n=1 Tax=Salinactinospora qingdaonensis TaxID=702744 RepID=A0ABP7GE70_9ACTN
MSGAAGQGYPVSTGREGGGWVVRAESVLPRWGGVGDEGSEGRRCGSLGGINRGGWRWLVR